MHPRLMPGRWTAAAYTSLMVALYVAEPAIVSLTVHDHVQLDRLTGTSAERYGDLLPPGTTPVHLAAGTYVFRTTSDAQVQLAKARRCTCSRRPRSNGKDDLAGPTDGTGPARRQGRQPARPRAHPDRAALTVRVHLDRRTHHPAAVAVLPRCCFGPKIWSMTSAPVVITGRSSRR